MKIVVIGGTGLIGLKLVTKLRDAGHDTVSGSLESGIDTYTGKGLEQALDGAQVVIDVSNAPVLDDTAVDFFHTSSRNMSRQRPE
jgi:nucleoside-diphosphate-sugar epimerase